MTRFEHITPDQHSHASAINFLISTFQNSGHLVATSHSDFVEQDKIC